MDTCFKHGKGGMNSDIKRNKLDPIISKLPTCYAKPGKGKCAYCAYENGFRAGYAKAIEDLKTNQDKM